MPEAPVISMFKTLHQAAHHVSTAFGVSGRLYACGLGRPPSTDHRNHFCLAQGSILTLGKLLEYVETTHS